MVVETVGRTEALSVSGWLKVRRKMRALLSLAEGLVPLGISSFSSLNSPNPSRPGMLERLLAVLERLVPIPGLDSPTCISRLWVSRQAATEKYPSSASCFYSRTTNTSCSLLVPHMD
jgi:hypothetical protein